MLTSFLSRLQMMFAIVNQIKNNLFILQGLRYMSRRRQIKSHLMTFIVKRCHYYKIETKGLINLDLYTRPTLEEN